MASLVGMDEGAQLALLDNLLTTLDLSVFTDRLLSNPSVTEAIRNSQLFQDCKTHKTVSIYRCADCSYGCCTFPELSFHRKTHNNDMQCGLCDYISTTKEEFTVHHNHHTESLSECCGICTYQTCSPGLLTEHTRLIHNTQYDHQCGKCGYETTGGESVIEYHKSLHLAKNNKKRTKRAEPPSSTSQNRSPTSDSGVNEKSTDEESKDVIVIIPKSEPVIVEAKVEAADEDSLSNDNERKYLSTIDSVIEGEGDVNILLSDRRPWWNTETEILPPAAATSDNVTEECDEQTQCKCCGEFYYTATATHQCPVVKHKLSSTPLTCTLCDYFASNKREYVEHCISMHSRLWQALIVRLSREVNVADINDLCVVVESYVPLRFKNVTDHLQVNYYCDNKPVTSNLYRCTRCYKSFTSIDIQAGHKVFDQCHPPISQSQYGCVTCGVEFRSSDEFATHHLQCHTTLNTVGESDESSNIRKADVEDSRFTEDAMLMIDALQRVGTENTCYISKESEVTQPPLVKANVISGSFQMRCQTCSFVADRDIDQYMEHVNTTHLADSAMLTANSQASMETLHGCSFCAFICDKSEKLRSHIFSHHAGRRQTSRANKMKQSDEKNFKKAANGGAVDTLGSAAALPILLCQSCGFQTTSKGSLKVHVENHNESKKRYKCDQCEFSSLHASSLTIHMRSHTGYRPFVCSMCGKSFITNSELRKHERRHAGLVEKRHSCGICGKNYATPQHLKVHIRRHTGDRPYKCTDCMFAATSKSVLVNHMTIHSGERNYSCHLCVFTCASSGTLSNHRRLKHNIVNKRTTLAETTPESILGAAEVAGKSKKIREAKTPRLSRTDSVQPDLPLQARSNNSKAPLLMSTPASSTTSNNQLILPNPSLVVTTLSTNDLAGSTTLTNNITGCSMTQPVVLPATYKIVHTSGKNYHLLEAVNIGSITSSELNQ